MRYRTGETEANRFLELAAGMPFWLTLDQWVAYLMDCGFFSDECRSDHERRTLVHCLLNQLHDARLWPRFAHVWEEDDDRERVDYYKLEQAFTREDYDAAIEFHAGVPGPLHRRRAAGYTLRRRRRFGI